MGYTHPEHAQKRLQSILNAPSLESWLKCSSFDFKYSNKEFLRKLFEILSLPIEPLEKELALIENKEIAFAKMEDSYIRHVAI